MEELIEECIEMQKAELIEDGEVDIDMESVRLAVYENLRDLLRDEILQEMRSHQKDFMQDDISHERRYVTVHLS